MAAARAARHRAARAAATPRPAGARRRRGRAADRLDVDHRAGAVAGDVEVAERVTGPSIGSPGMNRPTSARAEAGARTGPARTAEDASRRRRIGSVKAPVRGPAADMRDGRAAAGVRPLQPVAGAKVTRRAGRPAQRRVRSPSSRSSRCRRQSSSGCAIDVHSPAISAPTSSTVTSARSSPAACARSTSRAASPSSSARRLARVHDGRAEADERVAQPGVGGHDLGVAAQALRERLPRVLDLERRADVLARDAELLGDERLDQQVLRREVAIDGAHTDPGDRGRRRRSGRSRRARRTRPGRLQDALAVAPRVGRSGRSSVLGSVAMASSDAEYG